MREARYFEYQGKMYTYRQLAQIARCSKQAMFLRLSRTNYDVQKALSSGSKLYPYKNRWYTIGELAELSGCSKDTMYKRLLADKGDIDKAVEDTSARDMSRLFVKYKDRWYSIKELCHGINHNAYGRVCSYFLNNPVEEVIEVILPNLKARRQQKSPFSVKQTFDSETFEWKGKKYTVKELAEIKGVSQKKMSDYLDTYSSIDEIMKI